MSGEVVADWLACRCSKFEDACYSPAMADHFQDVAEWPKNTHMLLLTRLRYRVLRGAAEGGMSLRAPPKKIIASANNGLVAFQLRTLHN